LARCPAFGGFAGCTFGLFALDCSLGWIRSVPLDTVVRCNVTGVVTWSAWLGFATGFGFELLDGVATGATDLAGVDGFVAACGSAAEMASSARSTNIATTPAVATTTLAAAAATMAGLLRGR
jgi:hypothetical protein